MSVKRIAAIYGLWLFAVSASAQLVESPLPSYTRPSQKANKFARTQAIVHTTCLPFWDDFSPSDTLLRDTLWQFGNSVLLNKGLGIRPPSINVVSFDGVDSLGNPYNVNDVLAKGYADRLTSQPIRMDTVPMAQRDSVFISFFYQRQGHGEPPDPGDVFKLSLKAQDGTWEDVYTLEPDPSMLPDVFTQVILPISESKYFHDSFQFRFTNFARLSGPYDTWNLDYIYLNSRRHVNDIYFPDRTISSSFTSLFKNYFAMPIKHFLEDAGGNLVHPSLELYNLKLFNVDTAGVISPHEQTINYTTEAQVTFRVNGIDSTKIVKLDSIQDPGHLLSGLQYLTVTLNKIPLVSDFNTLADSIHIQLKYFMNTKDNVPIDSIGDYDPFRYNPIDFRFSDTTRVDYDLSSYYAYDDGTAEYVAGLNQAGSFLAYQFIMSSQTPDTLIYVDICFPEFGDNSSQSVQLQIRNLLTDDTNAVSFQQNIVVDRKSMNRFSRYPLTRPVPVVSSFYVGWKQLTNVSIPAGLDKNTDNGDKVWYNTNGVWIQNTNVKGSLMVRPGFGHGGVVTSSDQEQTGAEVYPNPARGACTVKGHIESLDVYDLTGRRLDVSPETWGDDTRVTFNANASGLVFIRYVRDGRRYTQKLMVQPE